MSKSKGWALWKTRGPWIGGLLCGGLAVALVVYYILGPARGAYHSDCADTIFWAQASWEAGALYDPHFQYAALLPFGGTVLMLPFVAVFGVSWTAHTLGMLTFLLLFAGSLLWLFRTLGFRWGAASGALALVLGALCVSAKLREIYFGHIIYYSLGSLFLTVGLVLVLRAIEGGSLLRLVLCGGWFLLCTLNGLPSLVLFVIPVLGGVAGERFLDFSRPLAEEKGRRTWVVVGVAAGAALIGLLMGMLCGRNIVAGYEDAYSAFSSDRLWAGHLLEFLPQWLSLCGVQVSEAQLFLTADGLRTLLQILSSLLLLLAPLAALPFWRRMSRATRIVWLMHVLQGALLLFAFVFGGLANANWRLSPLLVTAVLTDGMLAWELCRGKGKRVGVLLFTVLAAFGLLGAQDVLREAGEHREETGLCALTERLQEEGLTYGYATFWNAGAVTVLSDSQVRVRNIKLENGQIYPYYYQSQRSWFEDQGPEERYFLLLTAGELTELQRAAHPLAEKATVLTEDYWIVHLDGALFSSNWS